MKYVVFKVKDDAKQHPGEELLFAFPSSVDHDRMVEACQAIRFGSDRTWDRLFFQAEPIAAGFINSHGECHGRSETLDIASRGEVDTKLLEAM